MIILHPVFTLLFIFMIACTFMEVYNSDGKKYPAIIWVIGIAMVIFGGLRNNVGADYPIYRNMYLTFFPMVDYSELFDKMLFKDSQLDIEWAYVMLNKLIFGMGAPFFILTLVVSVITVSLKLNTYFKDSPYPALSILLIFIPVYFTTDNGHMRQALGGSICFFSYRFIKDRKLLYFLLCMYIAYGFHKSSILFFPAYWLVRIPLNSQKIFYLIVISVILSPLHVYNQFSGFLESISPQDVSNGFTGYINYEDKASSFMDALMIIYSFLLIAYDKVASEKVYYYEYLRNILVCGVCCYFIFRDNPVFATRLVGVYSTFSVMFIPTVISAMDVSLKRVWHLFFVAFMIFYYFVFAQYQANAGRFTPDRYHNVLWGN